MKPTKSVIQFLAAFALANAPLHAATINLDFATTNDGAIVLAFGANDFSLTGNIDYLIVAGGGAGGGVNSANRAGGGGGAGGMLTATGHSITGLQSITVGAGGTSPTPTGTGAPIGTNGENSVAFGLTAKGGGAGGSNSFINGVGGAAVGSGGGGGNSNNGVGTGGTGLTGSQGNNGADAQITGTRFGGGGGGAGGAGSTTTGGSGLSSSITGSSVTYAAGGSGLTVVTGTGSASGATAATNTGNGGGGAKRDVSAGAGNPAGGAGGSGIVVASYSGTTQLLTGGTVTTSGGNTIHTFNASGSLDLRSATINGNISGAGGNLLWDKAGTLTLGGENTYTGTTSITLGQIRLLGLIGSTSDLIFGSGSLFLGGIGTINVLQSNYSIADANADIMASRITGSLTPQVSTFNDGFNIYTQISTIPEPSAALLGGLGLLALLRRRRA